MNKAKFIESCSQKSGMTKTSVNQLLKSMKETLIENLKCGEEVRFFGAGKFFVRVLPPKTIINNFTGEETLVMQRFKVAFKSSKKLCSLIK